MLVAAKGELSASTAVEICPQTAPHVYPTMIPQPTVHNVSLVEIQAPTAPCVYLAMITLPTAQNVSLTFNVSHRKLH